MASTNLPDSAPPTSPPSSSSIHHSHHQTPTIIAAQGPGSLHHLPQKVTPDASMGQSQSTSGNVQHNQPSTSGQMLPPPPRKRSASDVSLTSETLPMSHPRLAEHSSKKPRLDDHETGTSNSSPSVNALAIGSSATAQLSTAHTGSPKISFQSSLLLPTSGQDVGYSSISQAIPAFDLVDGTVTEQQTYEASPHRPSSMLPAAQNGIPPVQFHRQGPSHPVSTAPTSSTVLDNSRAIYEASIDDLTGKLSHKEAALQKLKTGLNALGFGDTESSETVALEALCTAFDGIRESFTSVPDHVNYLPDTVTSAGTLEALLLMVKDHEADLEAHIEYASTAEEAFARLRRQRDSLKEKLKAISDDTTGHDTPRTAGHVGLADDARIKALQDELVFERSCHEGVNECLSLVQAKHEELQENQEALRAEREKLEDTNKHLNLVVQHKDQDIAAIGRKLKVAEDKRLELAATNAKMNLQIGALQRAPPSGPRPDRILKKELEDIKSYRARQDRRIGLLVKEKAALQADVDRMHGDGPATRGQQPPSQPRDYTGRSSNQSPSLRKALNDLQVLTKEKMDVDAYVVKLKDNLGLVRKEAGHDKQRLAEVEADQVKLRLRCRQLEALVKGDAAGGEFATDGRVVSANSELKQAHATIHALHEQVNAQEQAHSTTVTQMRNQIVAANIQNEKTVATLTDARDQLVVARKQSDKDTATITDLEEKLSTANDRGEQLTARCTGLEEQLRAAHTRAEESTSEVVKATAKLDELQQQLDVVNLDFAKVNDNTTELEQQILHLLTLRGHDVSTIEDLNQHLSSARDQHAEDTATLTRMRGQLSAAMRQRVVYRLVVSLLRRAMASARSKAGQDAAMLSSVREQLSSALNDATELRENFSTVEEQREKDATEVTRQLQLRDQQLIDARSWQSDGSSFANHNGPVTSQNDELERGLAMSSQKLIETEQRLSDFSNECEHRLTMIEEDLSTSQVVQSHLESTNEILEHEVDKLRKENKLLRDISEAGSNMMSALNEAKEKISSLETALAGAKKVQVDDTRLELSCAELQSSNARLDDLLDDFRRRTIDVLAKNERTDAEASAVKLRRAEQLRQGLETMRVRAEELGADNITVRKVPVAPVAARVVASESQEPRTPDNGASGERVGGRRSGRIRRSI